MKEMTKIERRGNKKEMTWKQVQEVTLGQKKEIESNSSKGLGFWI